VIGIVVGQVKLEQLQALVDRVDQAELTDQGMQGADAAVGNAAVTVADFVMDVRGGEHRPVATLHVGFVQATLNAALALVQLAAYLSFHSKSLAWRGG
jgi:hypothetical protein